MDKVSKYRDCIQNLLNKYKSNSISQNVEIEAISDIKNNHYQIVNVGWNKKKRIYGCAFHIDIKNEKIWIQHNATDIEIAKELVEFGVPKEDIVLGFQTEYRRKFSDYAVH